MTRRRMLSVLAILAILTVVGFGLRSGHNHAQDHPESILPRPNQDIGRQPVQELPKVQERILAPPPKVEKRVELVATSEDAANLALHAVLALPKSDRKFTRYVWCKTFEEAKATAATVNIAGQSGVPVRPYPVIAHIGQPKQIILQQIDLRRLAPVLEKTGEFVRFWEDLQFDPHFNLLVTQDTLKLVKFEPGKEPTIRRKRMVNNKSVDIEVKVTDLKDIEVLRFDPLHIDPTIYTKLTAETESLAPILTAPYYISRALTTIQDKGVFTIIYGGRYYQFAGIRKSADKKKATDLDQLFEDLGVGNIAAGVTAEKLFDKLSSDQRTAMLRSDVTGKPRRVDLFNQLAGRVGDMVSIILVTHDIKDSSIDVGQHPIRNLLLFKDDAREVIFVRKNGSHGYALFDGKGELQDVVPPDIAADRTIPAPYTPQLQPAISCIRCHEGDGSDGWKPLRNDVKTILSRYRADIFGDITQANVALPDTRDRLGGLYAGQFDITLTRSRDDYARSILRFTGPWKDTDPTQKNIVQKSAKEIERIYHDYHYAMVTPRVALLELGLSVPDRDTQEETDKECLKLLQALLPPEPGYANDFIPEDPVIGSLLSGLSVTRNDWNLIFSFAASRAKKQMSKLGYKIKENQK